MKKTEQKERVGKLEDRQKGRKALIPAIGWKYKRQKVNRKKEGRQEAIKCNRL